MEQYKEQERLETEASSSTEKKNASTNKKT
jgi:hypothetical protein